MCSVVHTHGHEIIINLSMILERFILQDALRPDQNNKIYMYIPGGRLAVPEGGLFCVGLKQTYQS